MCDEQLTSVVRLRCQETRPTSGVEVATPFARDFDPSLADFHDHIRRFNDLFWFHNGASFTLTVSLNSYHNCASIAMLHPRA